MLRSLYTLSLFTALASALPAHDESYGPAQGHETPLVRQLYQYPVGTWLENIAVRSNGDLILTSLTSPRLDIIANPHQPNATKEAVYTFPEGSGTAGIGEIAPDLFAVAVGAYPSIEAGPTAGSWAVWTVDFRSTNGTGVTVRRATDLFPEVTYLDGLSDVPGSGEPDYVLTADIYTGAIYRIDTTTGESIVAVNNSLTAPVSGALGTVGVNGLHVQDGELYFVNSGGNFFASMPITTEGLPAGEPTVLMRYNTTQNGDDFTVRDGYAYLVTGAGNAIERLSLDGPHKGSVQVLAGSKNSTIIAEPTSCHFGRTDFDRDVLYVVTGGGLLAPINGNITVGGQVLAIDTKQLPWP